MMKKVEFRSSIIIFFFNARASGLFISITAFETGKFISSIDGIGFGIVLREIKSAGIKNHAKYPSSSQLVLETTCN